MRVPRASCALPLLLLMLAACDARSADPVEPTPATATLPEPKQRGEPAISSEAAEQELIKLERDYAKALIARDRPFLDAYYAPDFRGGNWMGFWTKSTMLQAILDDRYEVSSMVVSDLKVQLQGSVGIVQGVSTEVSRVNGKDTSGRWTFTDVFARRDGRWQAIASHTSELKPGR